jgi:AcrR family transcriptional regulator
MATNASRSSRPRDSAATKELLLAAATTEFAEHGLAGARIDRIAERAGANKRLLYVYFGDKEQLFDAVLRRQIGELARETPLIDGDLVAYAGARFDYMLAHPQTARLAAWRRFEQGEPGEAEIEPAVDLFAMVLRLTESWLDAPPALAAVAGDDPRSAGRLREHRAALLEAVRRITAPRPKNA